MAYSWFLLTVIFVGSLEPLRGQVNRGLTPDQVKALERPAESSEIIPKSSETPPDDILKAIDGASSKSGTANGRSKTISCQMFFEDHSAWLGDLRGIFSAVLSINHLSQTLTNLSAKDSVYEVSYRVEETEKTFRASAGIGELGGEWSKFRNEAGLTDGVQATKSSWTRVTLKEDCNWKGAFLPLAQFDKVSFADTDFSGANLSGAAIRDSKLFNTNWAKTTLIGVDLTGTKFQGASDLSDANLSGAKLINAVLGRGTSLRGADLSYADLTGAFFEPSDVSGIETFGAEGLSELTFQVPTAVVALRKITRDRGFETQTKELTAAIFKGKLRSSPLYARLFADWVQGGKLTQYGVRPWNAVLALFTLVPVFTVFYAIALVCRGPSGIWVIHYIDGPMEKNQRSFRLSKEFLGLKSPRSKLRRVRSSLKTLRVALYFGLISAFQIGYRELNVGNWIARLQPRSYTLKPTGWVRTVAGLQALVSVYLLALWALTFFGNPFDS